MTTPSASRTLITTDFRRNPGTNLALLAIITLSAFLMATGAMVGERLIGSIDALFEQARPPHFLQMHSGDPDQAALEKFAAARPEITDWQVEQMLNIDSARIGWTRPATGERGDLAASLIDNGFVTQNSDFDHLLGLDGTVPHPAPGEIWVPVSYREQFGLAAGDTLSVRTSYGIETFSLAGFVRDAQMASSMASSTRFVISPLDWARLTQDANAQPESIIEYRLTDPGAAVDFQRIYAEAGLPSNGPAVTHTMILLLNAIGEGLMAAVLVLMSALVIGIALLSLRFVIISTLTDEVAEIGTMKAIGLPNRQIRQLYLAKYSVLTLLGCLLGGLAATGATQILARSIQVHFAPAPFGWTSLAVPLAALGVVYLVVLAICRTVMGRIDRVSVVNALVHGSMLSERQIARQARRQAVQARRMGLDAGGGRLLNLRLAWAELFTERARRALIPTVMALAMVLITLPANLLLTLNDPRMATYMGVPQADLAVNIHFVDDAGALHADVLDQLQSDPRVTSINDHWHGLYHVQTADGWQRLPVEAGEYSGSTISFVDGSAPGPGQIALSAFNARDLDTAVGDLIRLRIGQESVTVRLSGIYQDMTNGGYTAKLHSSQMLTDAESYTIYFGIAEGVDLDAVAEAYRAAYPDASITPMQAFAEQTLTHVTAALARATMIASVLGLLVAGLMATLFMRLQLARDRGRVGVLAAIGFTAGEVRSQYLTKMMASAAGGMALGALLTALGGDRLVGWLLRAAGLGFTHLEFLGNPALVYGAGALALAALVLACVAATTTRLRGANLSTWLRAA